jgi:hypothetical protein
MEVAFSLPPMMPSLPILGAAVGIGIITNVLLALKVSFLMPIKFVLLFLINVRLLIKLVLALLASKVTILSMVLAFSLLPTMPKLLKLAASNGTGTTKSVSNAQSVGSLIITNNVYPSMTNVLHGIHHLDSAIHVLAVIWSKMVNAH